MERESSLGRVLGPIDAICIVVGAIIGVGIFFTPSRVAAAAGSADMTLMAWLLGGFIALLGGLTFAALGRAYGGAGAQYEILSDAYGRLVAFLFVFCNATAIQGGSIAIIAIVCVRHVSAAVLGHGSSGATVLVGASVLIAGLTAANAVGVRWGAGIQNLTVLAKVLTLLGVAALAIFLGPQTSAPERVDAPTGAIGGASAADGLAMLFAAIVPSFFAYGGWQHALWMAGEVRQPQRNVPLAIVVGVLVVVVIYVLVNWAFLRLLGYEGVTRSTALAADAAAAAFPQSGQRVVAAAVSVSALGVLNAQLLSGPRLIYRMALDGRFFAAFSRLSPRCATPLMAIAFLGGVGLFWLWLAGESGIDRLLTGVVFIDGIFFALTGLALLILRTRDAGRFGSLLPYGYPIAPLLFVAGEIGILLGAYADKTVRSAAYIGVGWVLLAGIAYVSYFGRESLPADGLEGTRDRHEEEIANVVSRSTPSRPEAREPQDR